MARDDRPGFYSSRTLDEPPPAAPAAPAATLQRLAICGPGRSGKDTAADWLAAHTPLVHPGSTSTFLAPYVAARLGLPVEEAFARRHEDRRLWYDIANTLRDDDPAVLIRQSLAKGHLMVGCRDWREIDTARSEGLVDLFIWIERDVPDDPTMTYGPDRCDVIVDNNSTPEALYGRLASLVRAMRIPVFGR